MLIHPIVKRTFDVGFGIVRKVLMDRDSRITGQLSRFSILADCLVRPQITRRQDRFRPLCRRTQMHAAERVKRNRTGDIGMLDNKINR